MNTARFPAALAKRYAIEDAGRRTPVATVFRGIDPKGGGEVRVSVLRSGVVAALDVKQFLDALGQLDSINHPHLGETRDRGTVSGRPYWVTSTDSRETLDDRIRRDGAVDVETALQIARDVSAALGYAHAHHVCHGRLGLDSILLDGPHAEVIDLGISNALASAWRDGHPTKELETFTHGAGGRTLGAQPLVRDDLSAIGTVLADMLTGNAPGAGSRPSAAVPRRRYPDVKKALEAAGPATPEEVVKELERALSELSEDGVIHAIALVQTLITAFERMGRGEAEPPPPPPTSSDIRDRLRVALDTEYSVGDLIGTGGWAWVYLARDLTYPRDVAIKVLRPGLADAVGKERFVQEIEITAGLNHPHIVTLIHAGEADGLLYYVMPYIHGESLDASIARDRRFALDDALGIIADVAGALDHAHGRGVIHRDIKPANILLSEGHAQVTDFGIALVRRSVSEKRLTLSGQAIGTAEYMSPEQLEGAREIDNRCDIYSLGCVLFELLTGHPPYRGSLERVVAQHLGALPPRVRHARSDIAHHVDEAICRALSKRAADRFRSGVDFMKALGGS